MEAVYKQDPRYSDKANSMFNLDLGAPEVSLSAHVPEGCRATWDSSWICGGQGAVGAAPFSLVLPRNLNCLRASQSCATGTTSRFHALQNSSGR